MRYKVLFDEYTQKYGIKCKKWWQFAWEDYFMYFSNKDHAEQWCKEKNK